MHVIIPILLLINALVEHTTSNTSREFDEGVTKD